MLLEVKAFCSCFSCSPAVITHALEWEVITQWTRWAETIWIIVVWAAKTQMSLTRYLMYNNSVLFPRRSWASGVLSTLKYLYSTCVQSNLREYGESLVHFPWVIFSLILQTCMNVPSLVRSKFAEPHIPPLWSRYAPSPYLLGLLWGLNELIHLSLLEQCLASSDRKSL